MAALLGLFRFGIGVGATLVAAMAIAAWFGFLVPAFDLFNHLQVLLIAALLVLLVLVLVAFVGSWWRLPLTLLLLAGLLASALTVVPETAASFAARPPLPTDGRPVIKLMTHNLFGMNYDMDRVMRVVTRENPDIIALQEYFVDQRGALAPLLAKAYPYSTFCTGGKRANIALYAKLPFTTADDGACSQTAGLERRTAHIIASFALADGTRFAVATTHFDWPFPIDRQQGELDAMRAALAGVDTPLLLVGDFNSAPWSYAQRRFADAAGLTRQTHGQLTWPARFSFHGDTWQDTWPILPLDQVMTRGAVAVHSLEAGPRTGSDHLPIIITFSVGK